MGHTEAKNERGDARPSDLPLKEINCNGNFNCSRPDLVSPLGCEGNAVDVCTHQCQGRRGLGGVGGDLECIVVDDADERAADFGDGSIEMIVVLTM